MRKSQFPIIETEIKIKLKKQKEKKTIGRTWVNMSIANLCYFVIIGDNDIQ